MLFSLGLLGDASADVSAAASADALAWVSFGLHVARCADVHKDELAATKPEQMMQFSAALGSIALVAMGGAEPSVEAPMAPLCWDIWSSLFRDTLK